MDFSTPERSLQSLPRRKPVLPEDVLALAAKLLALRTQAAAATAAEEEEYGDGVLALINTHGKERWEPLAVGIYLAADYLSRQTGAVAAEARASGTEAAAASKGEEGGKDADGRPRTVSLGGGEYYADGPRVPATTASSATPAAAEELLHHDEVVDGVAAPLPPATRTSATTSSNAVANASPSYMVNFCSSLLDACHSNMEHAEPRVRTLVSKVTGGHSRYGLILARSGASDDQVAAAEQLAGQRRSVHAKIIDGLHRQMDLGRDTSGLKSKSSTGALDDTTGWRALETHLHALAAFVDGCGGSYVADEGAGVRDDKLLGALESCCNDHVNRHVRAAGIAVLDRMVLSVSAARGGDAVSVLTDPDAELRRVIVAVLKVSLGDNWSQVRMAASVLCRTFLLALIRTETADDTEEDTLDGLYPILLPRMCLNRFYLAQGVKLYSHDTWKMVFPPNNPRRSGVDKVASVAGPVCRYYCKMCDADNHVVREAACQAVAELASKIGSGKPEHAELLSPFVPALLQALLLCFHDESWPVRDEAALACGTFCRAYPEECRPELDTLFGRWVEQLTDQIWSVREDAGVALGDAVVAYGPEMYEKVLAVLRDAVPSAKLQPAMTREEYKKRENDMDAHTDNQLYSCGSLAPKLKKGSAMTATAEGGEQGQGQGGGAIGSGAPGKGRIGCSNCLVDRPKAPWERTDGCIYLLRELCAKCCGPSGEAFVLRGIELNDDTLLPLMTELVDACRLKHYPQSDDLRATLWRQVPPMAAALGKARFKRKYLQMFLDPLMSNLDDRYGGSASALSVHAAGQCAEELADLVGRGIFRGRLEDEWQQRAFDRVMEERARMAGMGPAPGGMEPDGFSPFGPTGIYPGAGAGVGAPAQAAFPGAAAGRMPQAAPPSKPAVPGTGMMDAL